MENLTFGQAIELAKQGKKIARKGWNGKGMFVVANLEKTIEIGDVWHPALREYLWTQPVPAIEHVPINGYFVMKAADNTLVMGWLASQTDMLAEDWQEVI